MKIKKILKNSVMLLLCVVMLTGCVYITPGDDSLSAISPTYTSIIQTPNPRPTLGAATPTPAITPIRTPKPYETPSYDIEKFKGTINITCEFTYTNITDLNSDNVAYFRELLLDTVGLKITKTGLYKEGNDVDLVISGRNQTTGILASGTTAVTSTVQSVYDAQQMGKRINAINLMDYLDKMPNYTSKFLRKDIFVSQMYENSNMAYPYITDGEMYTLPLIGGIEGAVDGVWVYNKTWFSENGYELPEDMEGLIELLLEYRKTHNLAPLIFSSVPLSYKTGDIPSLATGVAATLGVDLDYFSEQRKLYGIEDDAMWQEAIIKMLTLNGDDLEFTLNTEQYLKALELIKTIMDNNLAKEVNEGHNFEDTCDNYAVAYIPLEYQTNKTAESTWEFDMNKYVLLAKQNWVCVSNQFAEKGGNVYVNTREDIPQNMNVSFYILENSNQEIIDRLIAFMDWCCTDEGIKAVGLGEKGVFWKAEGDKVRIIQQNNIFRNIYKRSDIATWKRKILGDVHLNPISEGEIVRTLADKVSEKDYHYKLSQNGPDMVPSGAYMDYKYKTTVGKNNVVYIESLDPTLFAMEVDGMDHTNEMYEYITEIISITTQFYMDFMSGEKTSADYRDYVKALDKAGIDNVIQYIENVYDNAYAKYYIPATLY